jgi:predicted transglutaminase-like cysteine proteinase
MVFSCSPSRITAAAYKALTGLAIVGSLSACVQQPTPNHFRGTAFLPASSSKPVYIPQSIDMDTASGPELYSCADWRDAYRVSHWPQGDSLQVVTEIDEMVRQRFHYRREDVDFWRPMHNVILGTQDHFAGDCDDLAATTAAIAVCAGVPQDKIGFAISSTQGDVDEADHMVAFYKDQDGTFYVLGDTMGGVRPMAQTRNRVIYWKYFNYNQWWARDDYPLQAERNSYQMSRWDDEANPI